MRVFVGTYSKPTAFCAGRGKGIYQFEFNIQGGILEPAGPPVMAENPSYLCLSPDGKALYAVNEVESRAGKFGGGLTAYGVCGGGLTALGSRCTQGADPCHVAVGGPAPFAVVSNYSSGSLYRCPIRPDGSLGHAGEKLVRHAGQGPNPVRQTGPHAHSAVLTPDGQFLLAADLGTDRLEIYRPDLSPAGTLALPPGTGPRFCAFNQSGARCYVICELSSEIFVLSHDGGGHFSLLQRISTLGGHYAGENTAADLRLAPDGAFLYASNRGQDSIAVYGVELGGTLRFLQSVNTHGKTPRNFAIDPTGRWLLVANQDSDSIAVFARCAKTGGLSLQGQTPLPSPVCILFASAGKTV